MIRCKIKCAEFVKNLPLDSTLVRLLAKVASRFLDEHVTTRALFKSAKIIIDALSTRKIAQPVKLVVYVNV